MGVHGLWKLLEPSGKPVPLETLENKILAVDVSIWLHQLVKGYQDSKGNAIANAHLLGLFHRICKLLFYKIKPVFVFDGGVPLLKRQTISARQKQKSKAEREADRLRQKLLKNLAQHSAVSKFLNDDDIPVLPVPKQKNDDMFKLPLVPKKDISESGDNDDTKSVLSDESSYCYHDKSSKYLMDDIHTIDVTGEEFKALPRNIRHDILYDLKESRRENSWGILCEMPRELDDFSSFQMNRLLKRRTVQVALEETEQELSKETLGLAEIKELLKEQGVISDADIGKRIASDDTTRFVYFSNDVAANDKNRMSSSEKQVEDGLAYENCDIDIEDCSVGDKAVPDYFLDNSNLSQEQILELIQSQNKFTGNNEISCLGEPSTSKQYSSANKYKLCIKEAEDINGNALNMKKEASDRESIIKLQGKNKVLTSTDVPPEPDADGVSIPGKNKQLSLLSKTFLSKSSKCLSDDIQIVQEVNFPVLSESESDTEFVDVDEKGCTFSNKQLPNVKLGSLPDQEESSNKPMINTSLQITVNKDAFNVEEDIFADLFAGSIENSRLSGNTISSKISTNLGGPCVVESDNSFISNQKFPMTNSRLLNSNHFSMNTMESDSDVSKECGVVTIKAEKCNSDECLDNSSDVIVMDSSTNDEDDGDDFYNVSGSDTTEKKTDSSVNITSCNSKTPSEEKPVNTTDLAIIRETLHGHHNELLVEMNRQDRLASSITEQMCLDAQELLQLFGMPYIVAPMEAEAQCAFLEAMSLTEGTITDDSDIWLFGGHNVYKNFFNQKKHVLQYTSDDIQQYFKLTRSQMVLLALLVGSDYTPGIQGIGPVTALEILASFPSNSADSPFSLCSGLKNFCEWLVSGSSSKASLRSKLKDIEVNEGFPNTKIIEAYLSPEVDESLEKFSWSTPDVELLRQFAKVKFGWSQIKTDEILLPVMKKLSEVQVQQSILKFLKVKPNIHKIETKLSKRVQKAVGRLDKNNSSESDTEEERKTNKRKAQPKVSNTKRLKNSEKGNHAKTENNTLNKKIHPIDFHTKGVGEFILQREKDKVNSLKRKLKAIEIYKAGTMKVNKLKRARKQPPKEIKLSDSSTESE